jgi:hypothetical protein
MEPTPSDARSPIDPASVRALRLGHGANCSSIGSVVDTLFVTALLGGALFAAVVGALGKEPVEIIGKQVEPKAAADEEPAEKGTTP